VDKLALDRIAREGFTAKINVHLAKIDGSTLVRPTSCNALRISSRSAVVAAADMVAILSRALNEAEWNEMKDAHDFG
jgi:hypothetical protein